jgi:hypothetical protein
MIAALILGHNLFKANKIPQAFLALNLCAMAGKKLHDLQKRYK